MNTDAIVVIGLAITCLWVGYFVGREVGDNDSRKAWQRAEYWKNLYDKVTKEK